MIMLLLREFFDHKAKVATQPIPDDMKEEEEFAQIFRKTEVFQKANLDETGMYDLTPYERRTAKEFEAKFEIEEGDNIRALKNEMEKIEKNKKWKHKTKLPMMIQFPTRLINDQFSSN